MPHKRRSLRDVWSRNTRKAERGFFHNVLVFQNLIFVFTMYWVTKVVTEVTSRLGGPRVGFERPL